MAIPQIFVGIFNNKVFLANKTRFLPFLLLVASLSWGNFSTVNAQNITQFEPTSGTEGTEVRIYGSGFDATASNNTVTFGETEATIENAQSNLLSVQVPSGESGPVEVTVNNGESSDTATQLFTAITTGDYLQDKGLTFGGFEDATVEVGDYDNDGDQDLIVSGDADPDFLDEDYVTRIYENDGTGNFSEANTNLPAAYWASVDWGDYDGDGDLDLVISGHDNTDTRALTKVYRNDGNGSFTPLDNSFTIRQQGSVDWGDFDGDGNLDLIVTGELVTEDGLTRAGGVDLYRNTGNDSFEEVEVDLPQIQYGNATWGDYNNDGYPDLAVVGSDNAKIYKNNEGNGFTDISAGLNSVGNAYAEWIDFNNDGNLDLFVIGDGNSTLYENQGDGNFVSVDAGFVGGERDRTTWGNVFNWGDYNADGYPDLVIIGSDRSVLYRNNGDGTFSEETSSVNESNFLNSISGAGSAVWLDGNGDGDLDLFALGEGSTQYYENIERAAVAPPASISFDSNYGDPLISWETSPADDVANYVIYRGQTVSELEEVTTVSADVTEYELGWDESGLFAIKAENEGGERSPFVGPVSYIDKSFEFINDWKLVSSSLKEEGVSLDEEVTAYDFSTGVYEFEEAFYNGTTGYWVKSREDDSETVQGEGLTEYSTSFNTTSRWYLIGSLADSGNVDDPNNVLGSSSIYRYDVETKSYEAVEKLHPGDGHWIYAESEGEISFSVADPNEVQQQSQEPKRQLAESDDLDEIIFSNPEVNQSLLYATKPLPKEEETAYLLPPKPPEPYLDVRTKDGLRAGEGSSTALDITTDTYPIQVSLDKGKEDGMVYQVVLQDGGNEITYPLTEEKSQTIDREYDQIYLKQMPADEVVIENELSPNYPNPFNPTTTIRYQVSSQSNVTMNVYNVLGQKVRSLVNETKQPGSYEARFDGSNLASGVYYVRIQIGEFTELQKMTLIK